MSEYLFSYGTLQDEAVQLATFGRRLEGNADTLEGYALTSIPIEDQAVVTATGDTHYWNIQFTGIGSDLIEGKVFRVSAAEIDQADEYEAPAHYERVRVQLRSGMSAWVYLNLDQT